MAVGLLALLILPWISAHQASAYSITLEVPTKLSLTLQPDGVFRSQASETPVKITSDAFAGYTFTIKSAATDGSNALKSGDYSIKSISAAGNEETFAMNTWGFKWSKKGGSSSATYLPGPTTGTVIDTTKEANATANEYTFTLGAKVDGNIAAGNYTGSFALMVTATPVPYTITYNQNTTDSVSGMPAQQTGQSENGQVILAANKPERNNYRFIGWCISKPQTEGGVEVCRDSSPYQASDPYNLTKNNDNVTLYAMWAQNDNVMQNWKGCVALAKNTQTTLIDIRDNRSYYVAKLADGNCWMTENLDLFLDKNKPLTSADSDVKTSWTPPTTHETNDLSWNGVNQEGEPGVIYPQSYDLGDKCWKGERSWAVWSSHFDTDSKDCPKHDSSHYHSGNYYNYAAAVAQDDTSALTENGDSVDTSICPAGWQLPSYTGDKSYLALQNVIATDDDSPNWATGYVGDEALKTEGQENVPKSTINEHPYYFFYASSWNKRLLYYGFRGFFVTSAISNSTHAYTLSIWGSGGLNPSSGSEYRCEGLSVRCVARDLSIQKVDEWKDIVKEGQTITVVDERDGNTYRVRRLADGKLWMVDNLRLGKEDETMTLTSADSDVTDDYTLPASSTEGFSDNTVDSLYIDSNYGGYYSWCAATAKTCSDAASNGAVATGSICPKGWHLPTGNAGGEIAALDKVIGGTGSSGSRSDSYLLSDNDDAKSPAFLRSGGYSSSGPNNQETYGFYWSSTAGNSTDAYYLFFGESFVNPAIGSVRRSNGYPVRCVAD